MYPPMIQSQDITGHSSPVTFPIAPQEYPEMSPLYPGQMYPPPYFPASLLFD